MAKQAKFVLSKDKSGKFRFNLVSRNGKIICTSEAYSKKANAKEGIMSLIINATEAKVVDITGK